MDLMQEQLSTCSQIPFTMFEATSFHINEELTGLASRHHYQWGIQKGDVHR
jgi:hypothetical protein